MSEAIENLLGLRSRIYNMANNLEVDREEFIALIYQDLGVAGPPPALWYEKLEPDFWDSEILAAAEAVCGTILKDRLPSSPRKRQPWDDRGWDPTRE